MNTVTWGELKKLVEEAGATDDTPIDYFDTQTFPTKGMLNIYVGEDGVTFG